MEIGNGATLEMIENLLDGTTPVAEAGHAQTAGSATKASQDGSGNDIAATYATKAELQGAGGFDASGTYPNLTAGEATHADSADTAASAASAVNATNDGAGNNIAATYATKAELAAGGGGGSFDASGTYPDLTAGSAQNVSDLYVHYIRGVDTRGGSGQCVYWNAILVTESSAALTSLTGAYLRGLGYAAGESFPVGGFLDNGSSSAVIVGLRLLASDYLALELVSADGTFSQFPVGTALSVNSTGQNGGDNVRRVQ